ncbi:hypothetical protein Back2_01950 [Nocardioides baekrokdamisoli]|uniref:SnoaL-like domain-containing protein n=1 Tax=Nocardioides baekrokdamisoli TaxID=1804624 RepID=A0A3G9IXA4_9ACTN|nr:nuclear transport factor 2 family protein [Nocardioides baekrokdamisoli]BBH15908.1 hypothetical protein Back2_01950 [Nocardioides baekrokdamisoli]
MDLAELSDRQEITDLITAYTRAVDQSKWDDLRNVFTDDAVLDYSSPGGPVGSLDEAIPFIRNLEGFSAWQHLIAQVSIELHGDKARATAYFFNPMTAPGPNDMTSVWLVGGYYHHQLVRTADGWRSRHMIDEIVWSK